MNSLTVRSLNIIRRENPRIAEAIDDLLKGHSNVANALSVNPDGGDIVPAVPANLQAQHIGSGQIDIAITDNSPVSRAINYYVEYWQQGQSSQNPYTHVMGPSRNSHSLALPNGVWNLRARSQFPAGGPPSAPTQISTVTVTGSVTADLFPSQGSGTGGGGAGISINRK